MADPNGVLFYDPQAKPTAPNGSFQPNCYLQFYETQTTTPAAIYSDGDLTVPLVNPVVAGADGRFPPIYLNPSVIYRVQLFTATNVMREDTDPFVAGPDLSTFVTTTALNAALAAYVLTTSLTATLSSYASQDDLAAYMPLAGGTFTGAVHGITPTTGDNSTLLATTAFVAGIGTIAGTTTSGSFTLGNLILNYGYVGPSPGGGSSPTGSTVTFHTTFPTQCLVILLTATAGATLFSSPPASSASGFTLYNGAGGSFTSYLAIGN